MFPNSIRSYDLARTRKHLRSNPGRRRRRGNSKRIVKIRGYWDVRPMARNIRTGVITSLYHYEPNLGFVIHYVMDQERYPLTVKQKYERVEIRTWVPPETLLMKVYSPKHAVNRPGVRERNERRRWGKHRRREDKREIKEWLDALEPSFLVDTYDLMNPNGSWQPYQPAPVWDHQIADDKKYLRYPRTQPIWMQRGFKSEEEMQFVDSLYDDDPYAWHEELEYRGGYDFDDYDDDDRDPHPTEVKWKDMWFRGSVHTDYEDQYRQWENEFYEQDWFDEFDYERDFFADHDNARFVETDKFVYTPAIIHTIEQGKRDRRLHFTRKYKGR